MAKHDEFVFLTYFMNEVLQTVDMVNKIVQSRGEETILSALTVVRSVQHNIKELVTVYGDEDVKDAMGFELKSSDKEKRSKSLPQKFKQSLITEQIPSEICSSGSLFRPFAVVDILSAKMNKI